MDVNLTKKIIFDYFDGKHSTIQLKLIEEWLKVKENQELFYLYLDEWESEHPQYIFNTETGAHKIKEKIELSKAASEVLISKNKARRYNLKWFAAAAAVLVFGWFGYAQLIKEDTISYQKLVKNTKSPWGDIYEKINLTQESMLVSLPDKSSIILQPQARISYSPSEFNIIKREVIVSGEAFFEVEKNAKAPFIVYANETITKVLGTSFMINALPNSTKTEVIVKTGKVAVFMQNDKDKVEKINGKNLTGLVLVANEKVTINRKDFKIEKPLVVDKEKLTLDIQKQNFDFEDTQVIDIFEILQNAYHIKINYNKAKLSNCIITAHLSDEPLMEKIKLICIAIDAEYEKLNNVITIKSNGCN